jgi:glycerol-3-phosphate dehydrogenase subunit C
MREDDRKLDCCVKCTDCNSACPVMRVMPRFPGPKALGPDLERIRKEGIACDTPWLGYCTLCNHCTMICPNQVNPSDIIARAKMKQPQRGRAGFRDRLLARPDLLGRLCSITPPFSNFLLRNKPNRWLMSKALKIGQERKFPKYRWQRIAIKKNGASPHKIIFFPGCFIRYNDPFLMQAVIDVLQLYGSVEIASTTCCGVPALANGVHSELQRALRTNVERLLPGVQSGARIVAACTSCSHMLKAEYPRLLSDDPHLGTAAQTIAQNTYDLGEFLLEIEQSPAANLKPVKIRLAYHAPCHLKGQGIGRPWLQLLRSIPQVEIRDMEAECCGMAGTFGLKEEKYQLSLDIGEQLFGAIRAYHPDCVVSECGTCRMQIEHGTSVQALHPAEILHRALPDAARRTSPAPHV